MADAKKARAVGFNHVALEVGDIEEALAFYGRLFEFKLRGKSADMALKRRSRRAHQTNNIRVGTSAFALRASADLAHPHMGRG
jgi:catechol 2,3-dioxygenase-like lactoylglutathione lyase family enzyme